MAVQWRGDSQLYQKYIRELVTMYRERSELRAFTEILLSAAAIFVFGSFAIRPTLVTITGLNVEINAKKETVTTMNAKIDNIIAAQQLYETKRELINLLSTAVPKQATPLEYATQIEGIASGRGVEVVGFSVDNAPIIGDTPVAPEEEAPLEGAPVELGEESLPTTFTVQGAYVNILGFLGDIENMRRPLKPESMLAALSNPQDDSVILLTLTGLVPYLPTAETNTQ